MGASWCIPSFIHIIIRQNMMKPCRGMFGGMPRATAGPYLANEI